MQPERESDQGRTRERIVLALLCFGAAIRVFLFSAAFPFFNNVDEEAHFDLVVRSSSGDWPRYLDHFSEEAARMIVATRAGEYFAGSPMESAVLSWSPGDWVSRPNHESTSPPLYYWVAGAWFKLGRLLWNSDSELLYWIRFLNVPVYAAIVLISYWASKLVLGDRDPVRWMAPLLAAVFPQDVFYSINSDVFSALVGGLVFLVLFKIFDQMRTSSGSAIALGFVLGGAILVKLSNLPLIPLALAVLVFQARTSEGIKTLTIVISVIAACLLPWVAWNLAGPSGDWSGTAQKMKVLGWSWNSPDQWLTHPIFSTSGIASFWHELMGTFWRGEFFWNGRRLAEPAADWAYSISTAAFCIWGGWIMLRKPESFPTRRQRQMFTICLVAFALFVFYLGFLSIAFDFGHCPYPSRSHPFMTSGRLMAAVLVPFFIVWAKGFQLALKSCGLEGSELPAMAAICLLIFLPDAGISIPVFSSPSNWFHLP